jgi:hypothetical protein
MQKQRRTEVTTIHSTPPSSFRTLHAAHEHNPPHSFISTSFFPDRVAITPPSFASTSLPPSPPGLNTTDPSLQYCLPTPELKLYALPYGLMGFVLHPTAYYILGCIAILQRSVTTLRPIKQPLITSTLCLIRGVSAFSLVAANTFIMPDPSVVAGYLAVNAVLPLLAGISGVQSLWEHETDYTL